jgi:hypothetical protein
VLCFCFASLRFAKRHMVPTVLADATARQSVGQSAALHADTALTQHTGGHAQGHTQSAPIHKATHPAPSLSLVCMHKT